MSQKRRPPFETLQLPTEAKRLVVSEHRAVVSVLKRWYDTECVNRKTLVSRSIGRSNGFMPDVFAENRPISLDRLLAFLNLVDKSLTDLIEAVNLNKRLSRPASQSSFPLGPSSGLLPVTPAPVLMDEEHWIRDLVVDPTDVTSSKPDAVLDLANRDPAEALRVVNAFVRLSRQLHSARMPGDDAYRLCWHLGVYSALLRKAGQLAKSAKLLKLAFDLEQKNECLETRAFLYRAAARLNADLGALAPAEECVEAAITLSYGAECRGLGQSLFSKALIAKWRGRPGDALSYLKSASTQLPATYRRAIDLEFVWVHIARGDIQQAQRSLPAAIRHLTAEDTPPDDQGKILLASSVIRALTGQDADHEFQEAQTHLREHGDAFDQAIALLWKCRYRLDNGFTVLGSLDDFHALRGIMPPGSYGASLLLEISNLILRGDAAEALKRSIENGIATASKPWAKARVGTVQHPSR